MAKRIGADWRVRGEPDPVDLHVGRRIRTRRVLLGNSQETVAARLGISFQQLQKYESGANRVSASRLFDLAFILSTPIAYFFDEMPPDVVIDPVKGAAETGLSTPVINDRATLDLVRDFHAIASETQKRCVLDLVRALSAPTPPQRAAGDPAR